MRFLASIAAIAALALPGVANATTNPAADVVIRCLERNVVATFTYTGFSTQNNLTAQQSLHGAVSASSTHAFSGPGSSDVLSRPLPAGAGPFTVHAMTEVFGGAGRLKASAEASVTCRFTTPPPPPPPPVRINPRAHFWGPCGDPFYRAVLDNRRSDRAVTFRITYKPFGDPRRTLIRRVAAHRLMRTGLFDVAGSTWMTITGNRKLLDAQRSAPNAVYRACPNVPVIG